MACKDGRCTLQKNGLFKKDKKRDLVTEQVEEELNL